MATHDYDEKRAFIRMQLETPLLFSVTTDTAHKHQAICHDLSATGLLMSSHFAPAEQTQIQIVIETHSERFAPFEAKGRVIRVDSDEADKRQHLISVKFDVAE